LGLTQSLLEKADYHGAVQKWLARHKPGTVYCLVQFEGVALNELPRVYLATPADIAERLRATAKGRGDSVLYENYTWGPRAHGAGTTERIPDSWRFSVSESTSC
jgi:hypothetical protein